MLNSLAAGVIDDYWDDEYRYCIEMMDELRKGNAVDTNWYVSLLYGHAHTMCTSSSHNILGMLSLKWPLKFQSTIFYTTGDFSYVVDISMV